VAGIFTLTVNPQFASAASPSPESPQQFALLTRRELRAELAQGKREDNVKKSAVQVAVRGDINQGGSVYGRKRRVREKSCRPESASGKMSCD